MEQTMRNSHKSMRLLIVFLAFILVYALLPVTGTMNIAYAAQVYEVGPGQAYSQISDVPFQSLKAGDTVRIHWRSEPYKEKILISTRGTEQAPIIIQGVPGPHGQLPVLDGDGAVQRANMQTNYGGTSRRGLVIIALRPSDEWGYKPGHIVIENMDVKGAHQDNSFYNEATGQNERYTGNAAGIFVERGENITIRGSIVRDNSNGVFVASSEYATLSYNILIEGNHIYDNGNIGSDQQHNVYAEAARIVYQYNVLGPWKTGAGGNLIKDRSSGTIIRYNTFHNGAHAMDLVEAEDSYPVLSQDPEYRETYVYGNTILNDENTGSIIHYGGDLQESTYRNGTLHFYNNTIVNIHDRSSSKWSTTLFQIMRGNKVDFRNNIVYTQSATPGATAAPILLSRESGELYIGSNWISSGYELLGDRRYFDGVAYGVENLVTIPNNNPGFVNLTGGDYHLQSSSRAINQADDLSQSVAPGLSIIPKELRVHNQHTSKLDPSLGELRPTGRSPLDFGAYEFGQAGDPIVPEPINFLTENIFVDPYAIPGSGDDSNDGSNDYDEESNDDSEDNDGDIGGDNDDEPVVLNTLYSIFDAEQDITFTNGNGTAEIVDSASLAVKLSQFSNVWSVPKQLILDTPVPLANLSVNDRFELDIKIDGTLANPYPTTLLLYFNGKKDAQHWVGTESLKVGVNNQISLDLSNIKDNLGGEITQIGILTGYGWLTNASVQLSGLKIVGPEEPWTTDTKDGEDTVSVTPEEPNSTPTPSYNITFTDNGAGIAETVVSGDGSTDYKLSQFPSAWSVPKQLKLEPGLSLSDWKTGDRIELSVRVDGTTTSTSPTTLLFYFNGSKDAQHWVGTDKLKLGETQTVQLDLSRIIANLGTDITQIGVVTGYGWPSAASVTIGGIERVSAE